jgi:hypothetical protein
LNDDDNVDDEEDNDPSPHGFPQTLLENAGIITRLGYDHFLSNHFLLITAQSTCHSTLYNEMLTAL